MTSTQTTRCLLHSPFTILPCPRPRSARGLHSTGRLQARVRPRFRNVPIAEMQGGGAKEFAKEGHAKMFPSYTPRELAKLRDNFTAPQREAIEAAEKSVKGEDLIKQARLRTDTGLPEYLDDYAITIPGIDREPERPWKIKPPGFEWDEALTDPQPPEGLIKLYAKYEAERRDRKKRRRAGDHTARMTPEEKVEWEEKMMKAMLANDEATSLAPSLGRGPADEDGVPLSKKKTTAEMLAQERQEKRDPGGKKARAARDIGIPENVAKNLKMRILLKKQVINVTMLGRVESIYVLAMAGTGNGQLGLGQAKCLDQNEAQRQASVRAVRAMKPVPRYENRTIYGTSEAKVSATVVKLMARPPGFGLRCQHYIYELARAAGITDLAARVPRSRNPMNTIKAAYEALTQQRLPDDIARGRGRKLVDVRKVYYAGNV